MPALGIDVKKIVGEDRNPVRSSLLYLNKRPTDLIILSTTQQDGRMQWLNKSVSRPIARHAREMTLFIPAGVDGFVSLSTGELSLKHILVPVDTRPDPQDAVEAAIRLGRVLELEHLTVSLLYVGEREQMPDPYLSQQPGWHWEKRSRNGDVVETILESAEELDTDLIIMSTAGRDGFLDALRGSTTERVLRGAECPVLAIPAR